MNYIGTEGTEVDRPDSIDDIFNESEQLLAAVAASTQMKIAFGERAGQKVRKIGKGFGYEEEISVMKGSRCARVNGFSIHANRFIGQQERSKLQDLISYCARGAFSHKLLSLKDPNDPSGDLIYKLKSLWSDGTHSIQLSKAEFIEKLVALVPLPYTHQSRYFGILASHNQWRREIILKPHVKKGYVALADGKGSERMTWSKLLKRTYKIDITRCITCGVRVYPEQYDEYTDPVIIKSMLTVIGLSFIPPPIAPARRIFRGFDFDQTADEVDFDDDQDENNGEIDIDQTNPHDDT